MSAALLKQLQETQEFQVVMNDVWKLRPLVPRYHPCDTEASEQKLLASIRFQSGAQEGFDKLWNVLTGKAVKSNVS